MYKENQICWDSSIVTVDSGVTSSQILSFLSLVSLGGEGHSVIWLSTPCGLWLSSHTLLPLGGSPSQPVQ